MEFQQTDLQMPQATMVKDTALVNKKEAEVCGSTKSETQQRYQCTLYAHRAYVNRDMTSRMLGEALDLDSHTYLKIGEDTSLWH